MSDLDLLRRLGDELVPPPLDFLRQTARRRDRRDALVAAVACAVTVAVVAFSAWLVGTGDGSSPEPAPAPGIGNGPRPLTYAEGPTIHYGGRTIDAAGAIKELDVTDDGVAFRTGDGRIWFTDGLTVDQLGALGDPGPAYGDDTWPMTPPEGWLVSGNSGSRLGWFEFPRPGAPEVVVYDTSTREEVARAPVELGAGSVATLQSVSEDYAYWYVDPSIDSDLTPDVRYDLATGVQAPVTQEQYQADVRSLGPARMLVFAVTYEQPDGTYPKRYEMTETLWNFDIGGGRVTPQGPQPLLVLDGLTAKRFAFTDPAGYHPRGAMAWLVQWLDDDTVVFLSVTNDGDDLVECHVSTGGCAIAISGDHSLVAPEYG